MQRCDAHRSTQFPPGFFALYHSACSWLFQIPFMNNIKHNFRCYGYWISKVTLVSPLPYTFERLHCSLLVTVGCEQCNVPWYNDHTRFHQNLSICSHKRTVKWRLHRRSRELVATGVEKKRTSALKCVYVNAVSTRITSFNGNGKLLSTEYWENNLCDNFFAYKIKFHKEIPNLNKAVCNPL
jgi:hypothetical protein